jgi:hypothetical protein
MVGICYGNKRHDHHLRLVILISVPVDSVLNKFTLVDAHKS